MAEGRAQGGSAKRYDQALQQPARIVRRARRQPKHDCAVAKTLAPPLREKRSLAVPCRSLDQDCRYVPKAARVEQKPGTAEQIALNTRRRGFEDQPGRGLLTKRGI